MKTFSNALIYVSLGVLLVISGVSKVLAQDDQLPFVTGTVYDGERISWNTLPEAAGYNIYFEFQYLDTVIGTSFIPDMTGEYRISAFDRMGRFSPLQLIIAGAVPTSNIVDVDTLPGEDAAGDNGELTGNDQLPPVSGVVFDGQTISWDVLDDAVGYNIYLNFSYLDTVENTTLFVPDSFGIYSIVAFDNDGRFSPIFTPGESGADLSNSVDINQPAPGPGDVPDPLAPQNLTIDFYGRTVAELFWDRPLPNQAIVETEVFRDGIFIGSTPGISFFDDNRTASFRHEYELIAINTAGERSASAFLNPSPFIGPAEEVTETLLTGLSDVINNNLHVQIFPMLLDLAENGVPDSIVLVSTETTIETDTGIAVTEELHDCDAGSLVINRTNRTDRNSGSIDFNFEDCSFEEGLFEGQVSIETQAAGGYIVDYDSLLILADDEQDLDGTVVVAIDADNEATSVTYQNFSFGSISFDDSLDDFAGLGVFLNQVISDSIAETPRTTLTTELTVNASFTAGRTLEVITTIPFSGADIGEGNYLTGELSITQQDENGREDSLLWNAESGLTSTWEATLNQAGVATTITGDWSDTIGLPCVSATSGDNALRGCLIPQVPAL